MYVSLNTNSITFTDVVVTVPVVLLLYLINSVVVITDELHGSDRQHNLIFILSF